MEPVRLMKGTGVEQYDGHCNMQRAKRELINAPRQKKSVIWFPEGTWNQSDNLLMLTMKKGIIDVS